MAVRKGVGTKGWEHFNTVDELVKNILKKKSKKTIQRLVWLEWQCLNTWIEFCKAEDNF